MNTFNANSIRYYAARNDLHSFYGDNVPVVFYEQPRTILCKYCSALLFQNETSRTCCMNGKVNLADWQEPHQYIQDLFAGTNAKSATFFKNIRSYNSIFSFVSLGVKLLDKSVPTGPYCFRIQGSMYHRIGSLLPSAGFDPQFAQIYFYDTDFEKQLEIRSKIFPDISGIQTALQASHPYVQFFKTVRDLWNESECLSIRLIDNRTQNKKRYSQPTVSEVAVVISDESEGSKRDIILTTKTNDNKLQRIDELNPAYDCLAYPLFGGNSGFQFFLSHDDGNKNTTVREFYAYRLQERPGKFNLLLYGRRLLQQFVVDQYVKVEQNDLNYIRHHQEHIRADAYQGLMDSCKMRSNNNNDATNTGKCVILPSSFVGSSRYMNQLFQDSMAVVREFGKPDIFMTVTCNPHWPEIIAELFEGQQPEDRPDIVVRVFKRKLEEIKKDILEKAVFGKIDAYMDVIEFQKRGLPHAHLLLILASPDKLITANDINELVSAEIPNPQSQRDLYNKVIKHMIHGPCGYLGLETPCMHDGLCQKGFPKAFSEETIITEDGYPIYRRRRNSYNAVKKDIPIDNRWVVPYNPYMLYKYDAHINVEICSSIQAVKYLYKYLYKGTDKATMEIYNNDEIKQYVNGRYLSASEAWYHLPVHLPDQQYVQYRQTQNIEEVLEESKSTMLTEFFQLCNHDAFARTLLYSEIPVYYTWDKKMKMWFQRQKQQQKKTLSRLYTANPSEHERFYLRLLLLHVKGPTSYKDLQTFDGTTYNTFKDAVIARGLLDDDSEWERTLEEATLHCFPQQLRELFAILLLYCSMKDPKSLFLKFFPMMAYDFAFKYKVCINDTITTNPTLLACVGQHISLHLTAANQAWNDFNLPSYNLSYIPVDSDDLNISSQGSDCFHESKLNNNQYRIFNEIINAVKELAINRKQILFYIDGPGGTGKTYLTNTILSYAKNHDIYAIAVASTGLASMLLIDGRTAHSQFEIPLELTKETTCNIPKQSKLAKLLQTIDLIIWDEAPMMHRFAFEALDRTLQDIRNSYLIMGGIVTVLCGDFRQILPIIPKGSRTDIIQATLKESYLWKHIKCLKHYENMRLSESSRSWNEFLLAIGEGRYPSTMIDQEEYIRLPDSIVLSAGKTLNDLISFVFKNHFYDNKDSVILTPKSKDAQKINDMIVSQCITRSCYEYNSADSTEYINKLRVNYSEDEEEEYYPTELLNSINPSGMPPHSLTLKVGIPIILIRSIAPKAGLYNGTRLRIDSLQSKIITATITTGRCIGKQVKLPRIDCYYRNKELPFTLIRRQFPILIAFALTINRSEGQGFQNLRIYLPSPVFSHGQLYVALSRCTSIDRLRVLIEHNKNNKQEFQSLTKNIVYPEIFYTSSSKGNKKYRVQMITTNKIHNK